MAQAGGPAGSPRHPARSRSRLLGRTFRAAGGRVAVLPIAAAVLVGCVAEENDGREFANNPRPSTSVPLPTSPSLDAAAGAGLPSIASPIAAPVATPIDPVALLDVRGGPNRLFFRLGREVWTLRAGDGKARRVWSPAEETTLVDHAASPNGQRVAVLVAEPDGASSGVVILDADGRELGRAEGFDRLVGAASPRARSIDWSPQGDRLLVAFAPGGVVALDAEDASEPTLLYDATVVASPGGVAWSPTGEAIAFLAPSGGDGPASLYVARTAPTPTPPELLFDAAGSGRSVAGLSWSPDGREVVFTLLATPGSPNTGADLWRIGVDGTERQVVAGAGAVGFPGAQIDAVAHAPDGDALAFTIVVPGEEGLRFNSLWLKERSEAARSVDLSAPAGEAIVALWWTDAGLVFQTIPEVDFAAGEEGETVALYRATVPGEAPVRLFAGSVNASATPVESEGSPEADPDRPRASPTT